MTVAAAPLLAMMFGISGAAQAQPVTVRPGDRYKISLERESEEQASNGSRGSTSDRDGFRERIISVRSDGVQVEIDLPENASKADRASDWQLPARFLLSPGHSPQLLNRAELLSRVDPWLKATGLNRQACGHWVFTWNSFKIDCDPDTVLQLVDRLEMNIADLRPGAMYGNPAAVTSGRLTEQVTPSGDILTTTLEVDPNKARSALAESDVVTAEILKKPLTAAQAEQAHVNDAVSGTIKVSIYMDLRGQPWRRVIVTHSSITGSDHVTNKTTVTETLNRSLY